MFTAFVIGNIASGKSTVVRHLEDLGARSIDLDEVAKDLYRPGSEIVTELIAAFGDDIVDAQGAINRTELAARAFASGAQLERLNAIVHPAVRARLRELLTEEPAEFVKRAEPASVVSSVASDERVVARRAARDLVVVEISAPAALEGAFADADAIIAVTAPLWVRRERALRRGMDPQDFDRRAKLQPRESALAAMATITVDNTQEGGRLACQLDGWLDARVRTGER